MVREIPIAISACLLGEQVRYDGQHKFQDWITQMEDIEWLPVCPEVEAGMVPVWSEGLPEPVSLGNGRFVDRLVEQWRDLPLADETMLQQEQGRQQFLQQVRDYWTRQQD